MFYKYYLTLVGNNFTSLNLNIFPAHVFKDKAILTVKAAVGSLSFGVITLTSHNNLSAFCKSGGLKELQTSAPLLGSVHFSANHGSFQRAHVSIGFSTLCLLVTGDVATS